MHCICRDLLGCRGYSYSYAIPNIITTTTIIAYEYDYTTKITNTGSRILLLATAL